MAGLRVSFLLPALSVHHFSFVDEAVRLRLADESGVLVVEQGKTFCVDFVCVDESNEVVIGQCVYSSVAFHVISSLSRKTLPLHREWEAIQGGGISSQNCKISLQTLLRALTE